MRYITYHIKIVLNPVKLLYASVIVLFYVLRIHIHINVMIVLCDLYIIFSKVSFCICILVMPLHVQYMSC